ncbi:MULTISPECIES: hypothetical protein [Leisingera]|jgi:hypothetical protein|uniref:Uncharacterized protein n=1 Tax=Leisingera aquaemixtae TaxID=1396826 RepID=A0A0P1HWZ2_9RHOB|nr:MULTISPECIES: hypothetical protein [Leisingera]QDI76455.1 hypothetical protein R2C4_12095 [Leisingera aquaemixtae]UWQ25873.1 hypothetical protein K3553_05260 [Leisingera aquaemixtae]UWQ38373.1 hypothetical protein K3552_05015 [Leisingera aquaemixtae]UWQ42490.1 hypothetical protein K3718_05210 [Leisingera aquaemixtae]UWQ46782.1 hypothetical protein K3719_05295 [Leisingera aquaemixtae]
MKPFLTAALCAGFLAALAPAGVSAGAIERACRQSDRTAATPSLCSCIQNVANRSLTRSERKTVSKWFADPHKAQVVRQSSNRNDERLWQRYKAFGDHAARSCS